MSAVDPQFAFDFTDRYADYLNPLPDVNSVREHLKLVPPKDRAGLKFVYPVQAAISHGITSNSTGTAFALNAARPGTELQAQLDGSDLVMRETLPYSAMLKGRNGVSKSGDAAAYWEPYDKIVYTMTRGMEYYTELNLLFGPGAGATILDDIGVVATTPVFGGTGPNYGSATHPLVQLTRASWSAGIWNLAGSGGGASSGMLVDILNAAGTATVETGVQIEGIGDPSLCQVQMFKAASAVAVTAGTRILPAGWFATSAAGLGGILRNTGTFANINAATNNFWRARSFNAAGPLTRVKMLQAAAKLQPNGGKKGLIGFVHALTFADLVEETSAATRWLNSDGDNSKKTQGTDTIEFISPVGPIKLIRHEFMKQGVAYFIEPETSVRVGASDITMRGADGKGDIFLELPSNAGSEVRSLSQQAALLTVPYHNLIVQGIQNNGDDTSGS
jgi:hypothetical protein